MDWMEQKVWQEGGNQAALFTQERMQGKLWE